MSLPLLPFDVWVDGTDPEQPWNDNVLRAAILGGVDVNNATTAQPALTSPADDYKAYIIQSTHTGAQWATFTPKSVAIFVGGGWYEFTPVEGARVSIAGNIYVYHSSAWTLASGGGGGSTQGKQAIAISAAAMKPRANNGCSSLQTVAGATNQPDIVTLDFDPASAEYAEFAIPMPKKWNAGTITLQFRWSHAATTTNFGVVWGAQALAVSDDDTMLANFGTAQTVTDTGGTTSDLYVTSETSAITVAGSPAKSDSLFLRVYRDATNGSDTLAIDARLHSVTIFVTTDADTDA